MKLVELEKVLDAVLPGAANAIRTITNFLPQQWNTFWQDHYEDNRDFGRVIHLSYSPDSQWLCVCDDHLTTIFNTQNKKLSRYIHASPVVFADSNKIVLHSSPCFQLTPKGWKADPMRVPPRCESTPFGEPIRIDPLLLTIGEQTWRTLKRVVSIACSPDGYEIAGVVSRDLWNFQREVMLS